MPRGSTGSLPLHLRWLSMLHAGCDSIGDAGACGRYLSAQEHSSMSASTPVERVEERHDGS